MPSMPPMGESQVQSVRSRMGQSLLRLHRRLEENRQDEHRAENLFASWQDQWSNRREQITRRLEMIEAQLDELSRQPPSVPRLSVIGTPPDADEMAAMGAF